VEGELKLLEGNAYAIEPDRLMQISLGQENPPTWMNAAPGLLTLTRALHFAQNPFFTICVRLRLTVKLQNLCMGD
jgi:hypothetical protein